MNEGLHQQERGHSGVIIGSLLATILFGLITALYYEIFAGLLYDWDNDPNYSHGFIVPFMSAFFVYERWSGLRQLPIQPSILGIPILILGSIFGGLLGCFAGAFIVERYFHGDTGKSAKVGLGAAVGRLIGLLIKLMTAIIISGIAVGTAMF